MRPGCLHSQDAQAQFRYMASANLESTDSPPESGPLGRRPILCNRIT